MEQPTQAHIPATGNESPIEDHPRLLVVVHMTDSEHAATQADIALDSGADGVFLINHFGPPTDLLAAIAATRSKVGTAWVGINPLGLDCVDAADFVQRAHAEVGAVDGLWCDNARVDERLPPAGQHQAIRAQERRDGWPGTYFGGVAFKYQREVQNFAVAARTAAGLVDVVCTSGPGTGRAADPSQLAALRSGLDSNLQLAVASGVTADNVGEQLPYCGWFLVATGVSTSDTELDPTRVRELATRIRQ